MNRDYQPSNPRSPAAVVVAVTGALASGAMSTTSTAAQGASRIDTRIEVASTLANDLSDLNAPLLSGLLEEIATRLRQFRFLAADWDGCGAARPSPRALDRAWQLVFPVVAELATDLGPPTVSADSDGTILLQWFREPRRVTVFVGEGETTSIRSWGPDIDGEMSDRPLTGARDLSLEIAWLRG